MRTKRTNTSVSLALGLTSISIITTIFLIAVLNDWNLSPQATHLMGLILAGAMILSTVGIIFFLISIKSTRGFKFYLAGVLNVFSILIVTGLIYEWL